MNYITLRSNTERQLRLYIDFLPHCGTYPCQLKLLDEIQALKLKIRHIDNLPLEIAQQQITFHEKFIESKMYENG